MFHNSVVNFISFISRFNIITDYIRYYIFKGAGIILTMGVFFCLHFIIIISKKSLNRYYSAD